MNEAPPAKVKVTSKDFASKFRSKREVYNFMSVDVGAYLPSYGKYYSKYWISSFFLTFRSGDHILPERLGQRHKEE